MLVPAIIAFIIYLLAALFVLLAITLNPALLLIAVIVVLPLLLIGYWAQISLIYAIKEREAKIGVKESFRRGWYKIISYLWVTILVGVITFAGFLLLVVPGIIFAVWYSLALYILVAEDLRGMKALSRSKQLVRGYWWSVLWRFIVVFLIVMVAIILFSFIPIVGNIVSLVASPFTVVFGYLLYEDLKKLKAGGR